MRTLTNIAEKYNQPLDILLKNLYDKHKTVKKVAQELCFHRKTIERKFKKLNIPLIYKSEIISKRNCERDYLTIVEKIFKKETRNKLIQLLNNKRTIKKIAKHLDLPYPTVVYTFRKYGIKNKFKNEHLSKIKQTQIIINPLQKKHKAFILGCLCGDASLSHPKNRENNYYNLNLWSRDKDFIQFFQNSLKKYYNFNLNTRTNKDNKNKIYYSTSTATKQLTSDLIKLSDFKTKSWKIPKQIMNGEKPDVSMFLKGLLNSDGHITKYEVVYYSTNLEGLKQLQKLLEKHQIVSRINIRTNQSTHSLNISHKNNLKKFLSLIHDTKYLIKRKKERLELIGRRLNEN